MDLREALRSSPWGVAIARAGDYLFAVRPDDRSGRLYILIDQPTVPYSTRRYRGALAEFEAYIAGTARADEQGLDVLPLSRGLWEPVVDATGMSLIE
jgi:hypothetical protein